MRSRVLSPHEMGATTSTSSRSTHPGVGLAASLSSRLSSMSSIHSTWNTTSFPATSPSQSRHGYDHDHNVDVDHHHHHLHHRNQEQSGCCRITESKTDDENNKNKFPSCCTTGGNEDKFGGVSVKAVESTVSILNAFDTVLMLSSSFICRICHGFMIDICLFPCGHMFCKFCGLSWLRLEASCPICHAETFRPFSTRCYEMESVIDDFYPVLYQFYMDLAATKDGRHFIKVVELPPGKITMESTSESSPQSQAEEQEPPPQPPLQNDSLSDIDCIESIQELRKQMNSPSSKAIHIYSPSDREKLRKRRRIISDRKDILLAAPCTSILQKLGTLGWGTSADDQTMSTGMRTIVWLFLCYSIWNLMYLFHHPFFEGELRTAIFSIVLLIAFNKLQMQMFQDSDEAPDLFDIGLWETLDDGAYRDRHSVAPGGSNSNSENASSSNSRNGSRSNTNSTKSSNESFKDCEDGEKPNGQRELEQILLWKREGKLDYEKLFRITSEMMEAFHEVLGGVQVPE